MSPCDLQLFLIITPYFQVRLVTDSWKFERFIVELLFSMFVVSENHLWHLKR